MFPTPLSFLIILTTILPTLQAAMLNPDPATIIQQQQTTIFNPTPPTTIPSFPEQSLSSGCPLTLPAALFPAVTSSCPSPPHLKFHQCCPVLATWLYSAYSDTALGITRQAKPASASATATTSATEVNMPVLPDDSETCVAGLETAMRDKGANLVRINETCDVVYCYCGIRLHPLSCSQSFSMSDKGVLVGDQKVKQLEKDCLVKKSNAKSSSSVYSGLASCSKCLHSLQKLSKGADANGNATNSEARTSKMRTRDCELMGLTWLLNENRDAYISTVTDVMRVLMMNKDGSDPQSCSLSSDGLPQAVDSVKINSKSSSAALDFPIYLSLFSLILVNMIVYVLPLRF